MGFLLNRWRGIGTRLYLALAFAVFLTLVSSGVGVYYFERSGNLNYQAQKQSVPVLEAAWNAAGEAKQIRSLGLESLSGPGPGDPERIRESISISLSRMQEALSLAGSVPELFEEASRANESAQELANTANALLDNQAAAETAEETARELENTLSRMQGKEVSEKGILMPGKHCEHRTPQNWRPGWSSSEH